MTNNSSPMNPHLHQPHRALSMDMGSVHSLVVTRTRIIAGLIFVAFLIIIARLFILQVIDVAFYRGIALGTRELSSSITPHRGEIYLQNLSDPKKPYAIALNQDTYMMFADGRLIKNASSTAQQVGSVLSLPDDQKTSLFEKLLAVGSDPYEPLIKSLTEFQADALRAAHIVGIGLVRMQNRFYPEGTKTSHITGYFGSGAGDSRVGHYGIEGYFESSLRGTLGKIQGERDAFGGWIPLSEKSFSPAIDGHDIILTIDRNIQDFACGALEADSKEYAAASGTIIVMEPSTGAILAMCNTPEYDPNHFQDAPSVSVFNNSAIFTPYEPGSVFKAFTVAAALDAGKVSETTTFEDKGFEYIDGFTIKNALEKKYGIASIKDVLLYSINTGAIFAARSIGHDVFAQYVERFGFGVLSGIELDSEVSGNIESLAKRGEIFLATGSFGQGLTTTPLQLIAAYAAIANHGTLMKPQIVKETRYADGRLVPHTPVELRQVISTRTAAVMSHILTAVIDEGHAKRAGVKGYALGGKTGTAQIPDPSGGYLDEYIHTFVGFGPSNNPRFVILVKYERPNQRFADSTTVNTFAKVAKFLVQYLNIPPER